MIAFRINENYNYQPLEEIKEEYSEQPLLLTVSVRALFYLGCHYSTGLTALERILEAERGGGIRIRRRGVNGLIN